MLRETLALAHPVIPFVTEEIWDSVPGAEGLLAASPYPRADADRFDADAERAIGAVIAAVTARARLAQRVGVPPGQRIPARLAADGYLETAPLVARLARLDLAAAEDGDEEPAATLPVPGGAIELFAGSLVDPEEQARAARAAPRRARGRDRARARASSRTRASSPRRRPRSSTPSARSSSGCAPSSPRCDRRADGTP